jgi:hypothetical protein
VAANCQVGSYALFDMYVCYAARHPREHLHP